MSVIILLLFLLSVNRTTPVAALDPVSCRAVLWTDAVNVTVTGNAIQKTGGAAGAWDASAVSTMAIQSGGGYVEATVDATDAYRIFGLGYGNFNATQGDVDFGVYMAGPDLKVYERGFNRGTFGTLAVGDILRVAVESNVVRYYKNGTLFYTSSTAPVRPLLLDTSINSSLGQVSNAYICGDLGPNATYTPLPTYTYTPLPLSTMGGDETATPEPLPTSSTGIVWSADMETADLSQWTVGGTHGGSYDSGDCIRPPSGTSTEHAHSGHYSMKMSIDTSSQESGCREFRHEESLSGDSYYYGAWFYLPSYIVVGNYWNIFQFKSETAIENDPFWIIDLLNHAGIRNDSMRLALRWKGVLPGPHEGEGTSVRYYYQTLRDVPVGRWFHIEAYLRQSNGYDGQITIWQDGAQLFDLDQVRTKYQNGDQRWSVDSFSNWLDPSFVSLYVDDATVSTSRVGP